MPKPKLKLIGGKFGKLTVMREAGSEHGRSRWWCECECGSLSIKNGWQLNRGDILSCGCEMRIARQRYKQKNHELRRILSMFKRR